MGFKIALIRGDGIGPEIMEGAVGALERVASVYGHSFSFVDVTVGGCAVDAFGEPLPESELQKCLSSDSVLLAAVGGARWNGVEKELRPETGLLRLRAEMGVYANLRPVKIFPQLAQASPLKSSLVERGVDLVIVRELVGGIYFGEHETKGGQAYDVMRYCTSEIERIGRVGFLTARRRSGRLCSVEKSNVLDTSRLWKKVMHTLAEEYPDVELCDMLVDNCAMQLVKDPSQFDVIVTENMFGDILSDEAAQLTGSIGMIPSASLGETTRGLYEPIHGSAPDLAGQDRANPIGMILSAAMMLRHSFGLETEAQAIERAVNRALSEGFRTEDVFSEGTKLVGCRECARLVFERID